MPADFIVWGKLFDREALGPRCRVCVSDQLGHDVVSRPSQYAVFDLRDDAKDQT